MDRPDHGRSSGHSNRNKEALDREIFQLREELEALRGNEPECCREEMDDLLTHLEPLLLGTRESSLLPTHVAPPTQSNSPTHTSASSRTVESLQSALESVERRQRLELNRALESEHQLNQRVQALGAENATLKNRVSDFEARETAEGNSHMQLLEQQLEIANTTVGRLRYDNQRLQSSVDTERASARQFEARCDQLDQQLRALQDEQEHAQDQYDDKLSAVIREQRNRIEYLEQQLHSANPVHKQTEDLEQAYQQIEELQQENSHWKYTAKTLQTLVERTQRQNEAGRRQQSQYRAVEDDTLDDSLLASGEFGNDINDLLNRLLEGDCSQNQVFIVAQVRSRVRDMSVEIETLSRANVQFDEALQQCRDELASARQNNTQLQQQLETERSSQPNRSPESTQTNAQAGNASRRKLAHVEFELDRALAEADKWRQAYEAHERERQSLIQQLELLDLQGRQQHPQSTSSPPPVQSAHLESLQAAIEEKDREIQTLRRSLEIAESQLHLFENEKRNPVITAVDGRVIQDLESHVEALTQLLAATEESDAACRRRLVQLDNAAADHRALMAARLELASCHDRIATQKAERLKLQQELDKVRLNRSDSRGEARIAGMEKPRTKTEKTLMDEYLLLQESFNLLQEESAQHAIARDVAERHVTEMETQLHEFLEQWKKDQLAFHEDIARMRTVLHRRLADDVHHRSRAAETETAALRTECETLKSTVALLAAKVEDHRHEKLAQENALLQNLLRQQQESVDSKELENALEQISRLEAHVHELQAQREAAVRIANTLQVESNRMCAERDSAVRELGLARLECEKLQAAYQQSEQKLVTFVSAEETRFAEVRQACETATQKLQSHIAKQEAFIQEINLKNHNLEFELNGLRDRLHAAADERLSVAAFLRQMDEYLSRAPHGHQHSSASASSLTDSSRPPVGEANTLVFNDTLTTSESDQPRQSLTLSELGSSRSQIPLNGNGHSHSAMRLTTDESIAQTPQAVRVTREAKERLRNHLRQLSGDQQLGASSLDLSLIDRNAPVRRFIADESLNYRSTDDEDLAAHDPSLRSHILTDTESLIENERRKTEEFAVRIQRHIDDLERGLL